MAAVTQNSRPTHNVNGDLREMYFNLTVVTTGDTLTVPLRTIYALQANNTAITNMAAAAAAGGNTITFTGTAAGLLFKVTGV